jgi:hypothetical protein
MGMQTQTAARLRRFEPRVALWALVAVYTYLLPDARIVYNAIAAAFGQTAAGRVPFVIVIVVAVAYAAAVLVSQKSWRNLLFLVPCGVIAFAIMRLVDNPNKHIHIPEYILMTWLLYAVLSRDYKGRGLFILIFVYASLLGVVDELEQGINPIRFYGASDMLVNSASALIGVFTIMGLMKPAAADWAWTSRLLDFKIFLGLGLFGSIGAALQCTWLFQVQAAGKFWGVYPGWLLVWNYIYVLLVPAVAFYRGALPQNLAGTGEAIDPALPPEAVTARLWIIPLVVILLYMHVLAVYVAGSGVKFD